MRQTIMGSIVGGLLFVVLARWVGIPWDAVVAGLLLGVGGNIILTTLTRRMTS